MAGEIPVTVVGSITEPALRFSPQGKAIASFSVASTPRIKDGDNWVDGETTWFRVSAFDAMAENIAESLRKGDRVIVQGRFKTRSYQTDAGETRSGLELVADEVGPTLRWAIARAEKVGQGGQARPAQAQQGSGMQRSRTAQPQGDPWATPANDEPPF
jgi:single-strand DNA-binding protein